MTKNIFTKKELLEVVDTMLQNPDSVIDYLENENSSHDVESLVDNSIKILNKSINYKYIVREVRDSDVGENRFCLTSSGDEVSGKVWLNNSTLKWYCEDDRHSNPYIMYVVVKND